mmetsp:Transcript_24525/g.73615  ORF Transcript_24525/g.73615 Transcript_24525/m.73615 type:complete len:112 (-) Transcript_24525:104-439(-)
MWKSSPSSRLASGSKPHSNALPPTSSGRSARRRWEPTFVPVRSLVGIATIVGIATVAVVDIATVAVARDTVEGMTVRGVAACEDRSAPAKGTFRRNTRLYGAIFHAESCGL